MKPDIEGMLADDELTDREARTLAYYALGLERKLTVVRDALRGLLMCLPDGMAYSLNHDDDGMHCGEWCWGELCGSCQDTTKSARHDGEAALKELEE